MSLKTERAWLAGIFEGEGHATHYFTKRRGYTTQQFDINVSNTDKSLFEPFKRAFGGSLYVSRKAHGNWKTQWVWRANAKLARDAARFGEGSGW